jgi:hypothetical protein
LFSFSFWKGMALFREGPRVTGEGLVEKSDQVDNRSKTLKAKFGVFGV